ncbi:MAG: cyclopropane-fatty-acyl-phospholipid synthase family protein, partial [Caulobacteraceae bacterium]
TVRLNTWRAVREVIAKSSLGFGEAYTRGDIDVDGDLQSLALLSFRARERRLRGAFAERLSYAVGLLGRRNTLSGSKRNIAAHYDLDNDFYRLWLDEEMQYTCAYFAEPTDTLEDAQRRKMDLVCRKLDLKPGELVVEAGGGWGGLALHMARHWGVRVRSFNISKNQIAFARERAERLGIPTDRLEYVHDDYRSIPAHVGACDKFASICMLEHVGRENYPTLRKVIGEVVREPGLALLQFISRTRPAPTSNPWLEKHVFPGYYNPSLAEVARTVEAPGSGLQIVDVENMRYHYALTLRHWLERFEANAETVTAHWGEAVVRTFRLYLNGGLADFTQGGGTLVFQALIARGADNAAPLTRRRFIEAAEAEADVADRPAPVFARA